MMNLLKLMFSVTALAVGPRVEMYQTCEGEGLRKVDTFIPFSPHRAVSVPVLDLDAAKPSHVWRGPGVNSAEDGSRWGLTSTVKESGVSE